MAMTKVDGDCIRFTGYHSKDEYGWLITGSRMDGTRRTKGVHVIAFEHFYGPVPEGKEVDHKCWVRDCVNPDHLKASTRSEQVKNISPEAAKAKSEWAKELAKLGQAALAAKRAA